VRFRRGHRSADPDRKHKAVRPGASVRVIVGDSNQVEGAVSGAPAVLRVTQSAGGYPMVVGARSRG